MDENVVVVLLTKTGRMETLESSPPMKYLNSVQLYGTVFFSDPPGVSFIQRKDTRGLTRQASVIVML